VFEVVTERISKVSEQQRQLVIERINQRRQCTLKAIASELGVSISTVRRIDRESRAQSHEHFMSYETD